jgi:hypothetical protein
VKTAAKRTLAWIHERGPRVDQHRIRVQADDGDLDDPITAGSSILAVVKRAPRFGSQRPIRVHYGLGGGTIIAWSPVPESLLGTPEGALAVTGAPKVDRNQTSGHDLRQAGYRAP